MNANTLRQYLSVSLTCWSLFISSLPAIGWSQTTNTKPMSAAECTGSAYQWNAELNRCMLKGESTAQRNMFQQCDEKEGDAKAQCYEQMRNQNLNSDAVNNCKAQHGSDTDALTECMSKIDGSDDGMADKYKDSAGLSILGLGINGAVTGLAVANMLSKGSKKAKGCTSATMLKFVGIGALAGQAYLKFGAKGNFKDLEDNYDEQVEAGDDAQFAAYDYLEAQQNEIVSVAKKHEKVYGMTALGYGATAVVAGLESMGGIMGGLKPCTEPPPELTQEEIDEGYEINEDGTKQKVVINDDGYTAEDGTQVMGSVEVIAKVEKTGIFKKITNFLSTSPGILTVSLAGALVNTFLKNKASSQKDKAAKNAEKVAALREKLKEALASSNYCPSRDDLSRPRCYCYLGSGEKNMEHSNSETCQALWANQNRNLFAEAGEYGGNSKEKAVGCYALDGQWDPNCKCRTLKDEKGKNACMQVPVGVNEIAALGPGTGIPQVIDSYNSLFSGGLGTGDLKSGTLNNLAARVTKTRKATLDKLNSSLGAKSKSPFEEQAEALIKTLASNVPKRELAAAKSGAESISGSGSTGLNSPALTKAMEKAGISIASVNRSSGPLRKKSSSKKGKGFDLYGNEKKADSVAYMDKKYNYDEAQQDIVEREDVSIWQVISNRYTTSGLRRLFDDDSQGL